MSASLQPAVLEIPQGTFVGIEAFNAITKKNSMISSLRPTLFNFADLGLGNPPKYQGLDLPSVEKAT